MKQKHILIIGGTAGIGLSLAKQTLKTGYTVSVVGRNLEIINLLKSEYPEQLQGYKVELSELHSLQDFVSQFANIPLDTLVFTSGMLSGKSWQTKEGNEVNYMTNHFSRQFLTENLLDNLLLTSQPTIAYISSIGQYKIPKDFNYNQVSKNGLRASMYAYVPNDIYFKELAKKHSKLKIIGFNPGPTKVTSLNKRTHSPFFFKLINPIFQIAAKPVAAMSTIFKSKIENTTQRGLSFFLRDKQKAISKELKATDYLYFEQLNQKILANGKASQLL